MSNSYKYPDGSSYSGNWNENGQRHGYGYMKFADGSQFWGMFDNGLCSGPGVMRFTDGSRYSCSFTIADCKIQVNPLAQDNKIVLKTTKTIVVTIFQSFNFAKN